MANSINETSRLIVVSSNRMQYLLSLRCWTGTTKSERMARIYWGNPDHSKFIQFLMTSLGFACLYSVCDLNQKLLN